MAGSINKVILVGNVGQDPQVRTMQSGQKVVSFSLATSDRWRDRQTGELLYLTQIWSKSLNVCCKKEQNCISKVPCAHANGKINRV